MLRVGHYLIAVLLTSSCYAMPPLHAHYELVEPLPDGTTWPTTLGAPTGSEGSMGQETLVKVALESTSSAPEGSGPTPPWDMSLDSSSEESSEESDDYYRGPFPANTTWRQAGAFQDRYAGLKRYIRKTNSTDEPQTYEDKSWELGTMEGTVCKIRLASFVSRQCDRECRNLESAIKWTCDLNNGEKAPKIEHIVRICCPPEPPTTTAPPKKVLEGQDEEGPHG